MTAFDGSVWSSGTVVWVASDDPGAVTVTLEGGGRFWAMLLDDADREACKTTLFAWCDDHVAVLVHDHGDGRQALYGEDGRCITLRPVPERPQPPREVGRDARPMEVS
jgi:hypothetical protein